MTSVIFLLLLLRIIESVPQQQPFQNKIYPHIKFEPFLYVKFPVHFQNKIYY